MDRRWWKPLLVAIALIAGLPAAAMPMVGAQDWSIAALAGIAVAALLALAWISTTPGAASGPTWKAHPVGTCPDCGYSNEGLGSTTCPECGGMLPPSDLHVRALLKVHAARGLSECVVCHRPFSADDPPGPCPACGSRHRRPPTPTAPAPAVPGAVPDAGR